MPPSCSAGYFEEGDMPYRHKYRCQACGAEFTISLLLGPNDPFAGRGTWHNNNNDIRELRGKAKKIVQVI
jgi:hypothetical protein